jgi:hypothetical protein
MIRPEISAEAKGQVRVPRKVRNPIHWKGPVGRERAIAKIVHALPIQPELRTPQRAVWRFIAPVANLPTLAEEETLPSLDQVSLSWPSSPAL